jgi:hypothetical protein
MYSHLFTTISAAFTHAFTPVLSSGANGYIRGMPQTKDVGISVKANHEPLKE